VSGGAGGGWLSYDRKDRILEMPSDDVRGASRDTDKPHH
jgi:hypothetical protein